MSTINWKPGQKKLVGDGRQTLAIDGKVMSLRYKLDLRDNGKVQLQSDIGGTSGVTLGTFDSHEIASSWASKFSEVQDQQGKSLLIRSDEIRSSFNHSHTRNHMQCSKCEKRGIAAKKLADEFAGIVGAPKIRRKKTSNEKNFLILELKKRLNRALATLEALGMGERLDEK